MNVALLRGEMVRETIQGRPLIFRRRDGFGNLTELAHSLGQRPSHYLRLPRAKALIANVTKRGGQRGNSFAIDATKGSHGVTWVHPYLLIDCAMHFDGYFGFSCYNALLRLVAKGAVVGPDGETLHAELALPVPDAAPAAPAAPSPNAVKGMVCCVRLRNLQTAR